jgi:hypothetical protein
MGHALQHGNKRDEGESQLLAADFSWPRGRLCKYDKVSDFQKEDREAKKERKAAAAAASEKREVEKLWEQMSDLIAEQVELKIREIIPNELWEGLAAWNAAGRQGPLVGPSFSGSNSI